MIRDVRGPGRAALGAAVSPEKFFPDSFMILRLRLLRVMWRYDIDEGKAGANTSNLRASASIDATPLFSPAVLCPQ